MKQSFLLCGLLINLLFISCNEGANNTGLNEQGLINFNNLHVGQISKYVKFKISDDSIRSYERDTLIVEVIDQICSSFVFHEYYTSGSVSNDDGAPSQNSAFNNIEYKVQLQNDHMVLTCVDEINNRFCRSHLLPTSGFPLKIPLSFNSDKYFSYDSLRPCFCLSQYTSNAFVTSVRLANMSFDTLRLVINNVGTGADDFGEVHLLSDSLGIICNMVYSPWVCSSAIGWEIF